jgi:hypothetical protein
MRHRYAPDSMPLAIGQLLVGRFAVGVFRGLKRTQLFHHRKWYKLGGYWPVSVWPRPLE